MVTDARLAELITAMTGEGFADFPVNDDLVACLRELQTRRGQHEEWIAELKRLGQQPKWMWQPINTAPLAKNVLLWAGGWRHPFVGCRNGDHGACYIDGDPGFQI